jgi:hypothetical protein
MTRFWGRAGRTGSAGAPGLLLALVLGAGVAGCAGEESADAPGDAGGPPDNHATAVADTTQHPSAAADTTAPPCPATGLWAECSVIERLEQAGLVMDKGQQPATEKPLERQGSTCSVRSATLEVFIYPTRAARERDQARLDPEEYLAADQDPGPVHKPTLVTSENVLVVLDTHRERQRERITLALTAGPPQPAEP